VRITAVLESRTGEYAAYRWFADSPENQSQVGGALTPEISVGTGLIYFDGEGNVSSVTNDTVSIARDGTSSTTLEFELDFSGLSGLSSPTSSLSATRQDGSAPGVLTSFIVGEDGLIRGVFSNGIARDLGQIQLARFANNAGLEAKGENLFAPGVNSGLPITDSPGAQGIGTIIAGAQELSNADIGQNLIDLITASTAYRGGARVITTVQQLFDELLNLRR
jgi:flagellar hook protein FlgE